MPRVYVNTTGDGAAYVDNYTVTEGMDFTLTCIPDTGATLDDIRMWTSYDESIACQVIPVQTITYQSIWKNVYIDVYFSGAPVPPSPEPPRAIKKFPWLFANKSSNRWREI